MANFQFDQMFKKYSILVWLWILEISAQRAVDFWKLYVYQKGSYNHISSNNYSAVCVIL